jgi:hypothetical protein
MFSLKLHSKVQLLMRQAVELADYSQKEIQRQDGQVCPYVTLIIGDF